MAAQTREISDFGLLDALRRPPVQSRYEVLIDSDKRAGENPLQVNLNAS